MITRTHAGRRETPPRSIRAPYAAQTLADDETLSARGRFHALHWALVLGLTILVGWLIVPLWWLGPRLVQMATTELSLTNRRIILKTGWLRRDTNELPLDSIENVQIHQDLIGRMLGIGRIVLQGAGGGRLITPLIANVLGFRRALENAMPDRTTESPQDQDLAPHQ